MHHPNPYNLPMGGPNPTQMGYMPQIPNLNLPGMPSMQSAAALQVREERNPFISFILHPFSILSYPPSSFRFHVNEQQQKKK